MERTYNSKTSGFPESMVATRSADKPKQAKLEDFGGVAGAVAAAGGRGASTSTTATTKKQQPVSQEKTSSSKRKSSDTANTTTTTAAGNGPQQRRGTKRRAGGRGASAKEASSTTDADDSASPLDPHRPSAANPEAIKGNGPVSPALKRQRGDDGGAAGAGGDKAGKQGGSAQQGSKQQQQQQHFSADASSLEKPIVINRSPVLQLWGACVAGFLHPELGWEVCLNIGKWEKEKLGVSVPACVPVPETGSAFWALGWAVTRRAVRWGEGATCFA